MLQQREEPLEQEVFVLVCGQCFDIALCLKVAEPLHACHKTRAVACLLAGQIAILNVLRLEIVQNNAKSLEGAHLARCVARCAQKGV